MYDDFVPLTVRYTGGYRVEKNLFRVLNQIYRDYQFYWCCVFYLHDDMELDPYLWAETNITLLADCRQEFLETCRIFTRQWRRHKWLSKLRQYGCKKNSLRRIICYTYCIWIFTSVSVNSSFSFFIILLCRTEFDGYCEGELIKVFSLSVAVCVCVCLHLSVRNLLLDIH